MWACLVVRDRHIEVDPVALRAWPVHLLEPDRRALPEGPRVRIRRAHRHNPSLLSRRPIEGMLSASIAISIIWTDRMAPAPTSGSVRSPNGGGKHRAATNDLNRPSGLLG